MKISYNEILTVTQKIFEGAGYSPGHYADAAEMIGWLALHGIGEWESIIEELGGNELNAPDTLSNRALYEDDASIILDGLGDSALFCGTLATEFAYLKAVEQPIGTAKLQQCRHPLTLLASLSRYAQRGINSLTHWHQSDQYFLVHFVADQPIPTIYNSISEQDDGSDILTDVTILFSSMVDFSILDENATLCYVADQLRQQRIEQLEAGIEIDELLWQKLQKQSKRILVEATEGSRQRGAGEDAII